MAKVTLQNLGTIVREKRGGRGLRAAAADIGTSAPTLSRIESGKMPDLHTFEKLCRWLELDPSTLLGFFPRSDDNDQPEIAVAPSQSESGSIPGNSKLLGTYNFESTVDAG